MKRNDQKDGYGIFSISMTNAAAYFLMAFLSVLCVLCGKAFAAVYGRLADFVAVLPVIFIKCLVSAVADYGDFCRNLSTNILYIYHSPRRIS